MFRHGKYRLVSAVAFAVILSAVSLAVFGTSSATVPVKLTPVMVSTDTSTLPPEAAKAEMAAVWRIFDRDTDTAYTPTQTERITVSMPGLTSINRIRVYGASSYTLNVWRDNNGTWEPVPSLSGLSLAGLSSASWNSFATPDSVAATYLLLEFIPQGNVTAGIREIELWGPEISTVQESAKRVTLDGLRTSQDALSILTMSPSHILEYSASPSELPVSDTSPSSFSISFTQNPVLFKRAYIMYDGYNLARSVSVSRRINNLSWSGGFVIPQPEGTTPSWASYTEEINPAWLVQGVNTFDFKSASGTATIRNLQLIVETDSGWNSVSSVSPSMLYDGDTTTSYAITASASNPLVEITFERLVQPEIIRLNLPGPVNVKAGLQYQSNDSWQDIQPGWQVDLSTMQAGWNDISVPSAVSATALRLVMFTDSLTPGTVVGSINEIRVSASPAGPMSQTPRIVISYPRDGEYFGRTAYVQGFVIPAANPTGSAASVTVEAKPGQKTISDSSFSLSLTKDETRFYTQADNEAWEPVAIAEYAGQFGAYQYLLLNKNAGLTGTSTNGSGGDNDNREKFTDKVSPGQAKKIQYKGVTLDIPAGAVDQDTDITIIPLTGPDLARMDPGMVNVTFPDAGYRFLPHGMKFKKAIKISFGYSKQLFAAGQADDDVQMYFYNEKFLHWEKLSRNKVDKALSVVESNSDHFTDIINSTLVVPEHAQALSFNPNSIKDIKAADPSANVNLIEPPRSNNKGTANLSYPIEVPPGRNKLQPNIAVQYNSSGSNGWMGLGWDIPMQAITIDTRWGVPRYDMGQLDQDKHIPKETETYMIDGEQLAPVAHRGELVPRTPEKVFHTRVEGQFRKIIRHGTAPTNYWWEVIDKNGTKYFYGGEPSTNGPSSDSVLGDESGNLFKWALRKVQDSNGNYIKYTYTKVSDSGIGDGTGGVTGYQLYLKTITYTGSGTSDGPYTVTFTRDRELSEPRRPDVTIDARGGFKMVTADLLRKTEVAFKGQPVRSYQFTYQEGAFKKTLLKSVTQYGAKGSAFNTHEFSYYDNVRESNGQYNGFEPAVDWDTVSDNIGKNFLGIQFDASALGGNEGTNIGGSLYIGFSVPPVKHFSVGGKLATSSSDTDGLIAMVDINGDGLPDKVFKCGAGVCYRLNTSGPHADIAQVTFGYRHQISGVSVSDISRDHSDQTSGGAQGFAAGVSAIFDESSTTSTQSAYFSEVNGDGLIDLVDNGTVYFNTGKLDAGGNIIFSSNSLDTPAPIIGQSSVNANGMLPDFSQRYEQLIDQNPLLDSVRRWVAPYDGIINISGGVQLADTTQDRESKHYTTADGVRVAIQKEGGELWSERINGDDFSVHPAALNTIPVKRGDRIYFRVQSVFDGSYDQVNWNPVISYAAGSPAQTDVNGLPVYQFTAGDDLIYGGREFPITMPFRGKLRISGDLIKGLTTDDVSVAIYRNDIQVRKSTRAWDQSGTITPSSEDIDVQKDDVIKMKVLADSNIDLKQIEWKPQVFYVEAFYPDTTPLDKNGNPAKDADGNPVGPTPGSPVTVQDDQGNYLVQLKPFYDVEFYPVSTLSAPQQSWTATQTGTLTVLPSLTVSPSISVPRQLTFTVKRRGARLGKTIIGITRDADGNLLIAPSSISVAVNQGDELFFDFSTRDLTLRQNIQASSVQVTYDNSTYINVPSTFYSPGTADVFSAAYRGWGYIAYNGNRARANEPIHQELLVASSSRSDYDLPLPTKDTSQSNTSPRDYYIAMPDASQDRWTSSDQHWWISASVMSSSRLGGQYISVPTSDKISGASAPPKITQSSQTSEGAGFYIAISGAQSPNQTILDYMDMNGDGFPDVVGGGLVQYTSMTGTLGGEIKNLGFGSVRDTKTDSLTIGPGGTVPDEQDKSKKKPPAKQEAQNPSYGLSGSLGGGQSSTNCDMMDVNGDGLPDRVCQNDDGTVSVQLNLGYKLAPLAENWGSANLNDGSSINGSISVSYSDGVKGFAGGPSVSTALTKNEAQLIDMNGDGLLDRVYNDGNNIWVGFNTGAGFALPVLWTGSLDHRISSGRNGSFGAGVSYYYPIGPLCIVECFIIINPEVNGGISMSREESALRDVKGDGTADHLYSNSDGSVRVAANRTQNTNLLKTVKRPLGGNISLEYQREGNKVDYSNPNQITDMPQSQWTLKKSTIMDGMGNSYVTTYAYANGYKDRFEREFFGFQTVAETHAPGTLIERSIAETFNNSDFYLKGLLLKSVTTDKGGRVWAKTANTYTLTPVQDYDFTEFAALTRTDTYFYDGSNSSENAFNKSTFQTFAYDSYGNVTKFFDAGEVFTSADDVTATITYVADTSAYIVGKPLTIVVTDAGGKQLRSRSATYEPGTGNLMTLTLNNTIGASVWTMTYYGNGNLFTITDPVGYILKYTYDDDTSTHVTKILDNFPAPVGPYYSTATYNPLFGQVATSVDLNKNTQANRYDEFGRLACVYGPYDTAPIDPNVCTDSGTITFAYTSPVISATDGESLQTPARAVTFNRAVSVKGHDPIIIKTITYIDGMKRIIETKKDADVNSVYGLTVSGKVVFDDLGRVVQQGQPIFEAGYNADFSNYLTGKNPTLFTYDPLDRTTIVMTPDANAPGRYATTTTTYSFGQVNATSPVYATTTVVDPIGNVAGGGKGTKVSFKDVDDRIVGVVEYNKGIPIITTYEYDPLGQIIHILDDKKNLTTVEYDNLGRRTMIDNPDTGKTFYGYDANGNLTSKLTANYQKGKEITYTYAFNRLKSINYPFSTQVVYTYGAMGELDNRAGRIKKVTDESGVEERYYGRLGETLREEKTPTGAKTQPVQSMKFTTQYVFDSFGRMTDMTYPDGEALSYAYDNGGLLKAAWGIKNGTRYDYITTLLYDEYGQRTRIAYGNGTVTAYAYDPLTRRLATLVTRLKDGTTTIQNLTYGYDLVGNVLNLANDISVPTNTALPAGPVTQNFGYDDLYQITTANGSYTFGPGKQNTYQNAFTYDSIGNFVQKIQVHTILQPSLSAHLPKETNYMLNYVYGSSKPHAVTDAGDKLYTYDPAGNMTGWTHKQNGTRRTIIWNEENRVQEIDNNGQKTYFLYDDAGERVIKRGQHGETVYVNRFYAIRNGELGTKHVFAGETRVLSKLVKTPPTNTANTTGSKTVSTSTPIEKDQFFYHGDHLGSSNMITDAYGAVYQHLEYFPYGESWIEEGGSYGGNTPGYRFTGKELDPETGLYYYGARYYDPVLSKWISADPAMGNYLNGNPNGGVYRPINLSLYAYAVNNPIRFLDPTGNTWKDKVYGSLRIVGGFGEAAIGAAAGATLGWTGVGAIAAAALVVHGADVASTGVRQIWYDAPQKTLTSQGVQAGLEQVGVNPKTAENFAENFDTALSVGGTLGTTAALIRAPMAAPMSITGPATRSLENPSSLRGATSEEVKNLIPENWTASPTKGAGGTRYANPARPGEQVRVMPGNPRDPNLIKQGPYARVSQGGAKSEPIPLKGNPTLNE